MATHGYIKCVTIVAREPRYPRLLVLDFLTRVDWLYLPFTFFHSAEKHSRRMCAIDDKVMRGRFASLNTLAVSITPCIIFNGSRNLRFIFICVLKGISGAFLIKRDRLDTAVAHVPFHRAIRLIRRPGGTEIGLGHQDYQGTFCFT